MENNVSRRDYESIIKIFSIAYVLLVASGLFYNYLFYKAFGIRITEYIELSEVLLLFTPMLADFFLIPLLIFSPFLFILRHMTLARWREQKKGIIRYAPISKAGTVISFLVICLLCLILYLFNLQRIKISILFVNISVFGTLCLDIAFDFFEDVNKATITKTTREITILFVIFISWTLAQKHLRIEKIERSNENPNFEVVFKSGDSSIIGNSHTYYLGRTRNYIFIHDKKLEKSVVLNVSDVKQFIITSKKDKQVSKD